VHGPETCREHTGSRLAGSRRKHLKVPNLPIHSSQRRSLDAHGERGGRALHTYSRWTHSSVRTRCLALAALVTLGFAAALWVAREPKGGPASSILHFQIHAQPLASALMEFGVQSGVLIVAPTSLTDGKAARAVNADLTPQAALAALLDGSGLAFAATHQGLFVIEPEVAQQRSSGRVPISAAEPSQREK
jgi:hypothetical protein